MSSELSAEQWNQLLSVLSLDRALPFFEWMGVPVSDKILFQRVLREVILRARQEFEATPSEVPAVNRMLSERLSDKQRAPFFRWAQGVFLGYHADQVEWSAWDVVFSQWAYSRRKDLNFLPDIKEQWFVTTYRADASTADVKQLAEDVVSQPLSDWDVQIYARRGWSATWESGPFSIIDWIVRVERLKRFALKAWSELDPDEREEILRRGQTVIEDLRVWMPGPLTRLDSLLAQL